MHRYFAIFVLLLAFNCEAVEDKIFIQEATEDFSQVSKVTKPLSLDIVIEQGMRMNYEENIRQTNKKILENDLQDTKESFLYPNVNFTLESGPTRVGSLYKGTRPNGNSLDGAAGSIGLEFGDYTIFNWGKDYLQYLNDKETIKREITKENIQTREFKQNLILSYVKLLYLQKVISIKKDQLRNASFIYRLNREKVTINKISKHDYYQSRSDYLRSQQEYFEAKIEADNQTEELATLINDPPGTTYVINDELRYSRLQISKLNALKLAIKNSPFMTNADLQTRVKSREYEIALRDNMPLPKLSLNLGTYKHAFTQGDSTTRYETNNGGNDLELVATLKASWTIFGDGGVFNRRKLSNKRLGRENSRLAFNNTRRSVEKVISQVFIKNSNAHDLYKIHEARIPSLKTRMDLALSRYLDKKSKYNDFHLALIELYDAEVSMASLKWEYFARKILLAQVIGVETLPGETFYTKAVLDKKGKL